MDEHPKFLSLGDGNEVLQVALGPGDGILANERAFLYRGLGLQQEVEHTSRFGRAADWVGLKGDKIVKFTNEGAGPTYVGFAAPLPGKIVPIHLEKTGTLLAKPSTLLCSETCNSITAAKMKLNPEGPFPQHKIEVRKIAGAGMCYIQGGGAAVQKALGRGESIVVEVGCIAAVSATCKVIAEERTGLIREPPYAQGFTVKVTGPGSVFIQSTHPGRLSRAGRAERAAQRTVGGGEMGKAAMLTLVIVIVLLTFFEWEEN